MYQYRFVYLANYAINAALVWLLVIGSNLQVLSGQFLEYVYVFIASMATFMLLSLWGRGFRADENYKGTRVLSRRTTICFTLALFIVEGMALYGYALGHEGFRLPATVGLGLWTAAMIVSLLFTKSLVLRVKRADF